MQEIYLDNAATTQPLAECNKIYAEYAQDAWQNPSALYAGATRVQNKINEAKEILLRAFGAVSYTHLDVYKRQRWGCHGNPLM